MNAWLWLAIGICFEVFATTQLKLTCGLTRLMPTLWTIAGYILSFTTVSFALKDIELGIAYAIWAGLGTAIVALIGIFYFGESISTLKILSIILIIIGVAGLNISCGGH